MRNRLMLTAMLALMGMFAPAWGQLPDPPTEEQLLDLVGAVQARAAGHTTAGTRARIDDYLAACHGEPERLDNHSGVLLMARGYPWEALWFLSRSALPECGRPDVLNNIGFTLAFVERHDEAERVLLYTVHTWPEFTPAWTNLARVYLDAEEYERAEQALAGAEAAEPGTTAAEEARARMSIQRRDTAAAADALVTLSSMDPTNPMIAELLEVVSAAELVAELQERVATVPMPAHLTALPEIIDGYEEFVLDELNQGFWQAAMQASLSATTTLAYQNWTMTQEVWDRLPADIRGTLAAQGVTPGRPLEVPRPAEARSHYPSLALRLQRYQDRYLGQLRDLYGDGPVQAIVESEQQRLREYHQEHVDAVRAGADPLVAMDRWIAQSIAALNAAHPAWLESLDHVRRQANDITLRYWLSMAGAIATLPDHYRRGEMEYLLMVATHSNMHYTGEVVKWYALGRMQVMLDREMAEMWAGHLHAAAAARAWQAHCDRMGWQRGFDWALEDGRGLGPPVTEWWGLDAGVFAIKFQDGQVGISGGGGVVGEASFNWTNMEFEMGIGVGIGTPTPGLGVSARALGVVRLGGPVGAGLGFREQIQASAGTPLHGRDVNVRDNYTWLVTAGRPAGR